MGSEGRGRGRRRSVHGEGEAGAGGTVVPSRGRGPSGEGRPGRALSALAHMQTRAGLAPNKALKVPMTTVVTRQLACDVSAPLPDRQAHASAPRPGWHVPSRPPHTVSSSALCALGPHRRQVAGKPTAFVRSSGAATLGQRDGEVRSLGSATSVPGPEPVSSIRRGAGGQQSQSGHRSASPVRAGK